MPTLTATFAAGQTVWVVDPTVVTLYSGTVREVLLSEFSLLNSNSSSISYNILLTQNSTIFHTAEEYVTATKIEGLTLLGTLVDAGACE